MKRAAKHLFIVYAIVVFLDLLFILLRREDLRWFSKPLLMPVLMLALSLLASGKKEKSFFLFLTALFLSWCGDVLLQAKNLFVPGLVSFLLAHVAYILYFRKVKGAEKGMLQRQPLIVLPVLLYIGFFLWIVFPHLGQLKIPVILYSLTIGTMLLMAINTRHKVDPSVSTYFIAGALLFVLSDSLLAINLFAVKDWLFGPFVMVTYSAAQYLLVKGALAKKKAYKDDHKK
jgi:uncharacterized membrane protein YhhN